ncbi:MAG: TetR family transcriptional regulator [Rhizobacter sp.]|nr:TetR family transcriptional regulator [Rhizobacter sp.]
MSEGATLRRAPRRAPSAATLEFEAAKAQPSMREAVAAPQADDGVDTAATSPKEGAREAILAAARAEFAAKGLTGARVAQIATIAGVNKQLIYYYFGSKEDLYRAALEVVYAEIRTLESSLHLGDLPPEEAMARLIGFSFDYLAEHPDFIGLLNHENARGAHHVRSSPTMAETNSPLIEMIAKTLARGVSRKLFRRGIDPVALYVSIAGMSYFFFSNRLTLSSIFSRDLLAADQVAAYRSHVLSLTLAGLRA